MSKPNLLVVPAVVVAVVAGIGTLASCSAGDGDAREKTLRIICRTGDQVTVDDQTIGEVEYRSDYTQYTSRSTGRSIELRDMPCSVTDDPTPVGWKAVVPGRS